MTIVNISLQKHTTRASILSKKGTQQFILLSKPETKASDEWMDGWVCRDQSICPTKVILYFWGHI